MEKILLQSPADLIACQWYVGREIIYEGVDLGRCMEYDVLQVVNRILLTSGTEVNRGANNEQPNDNAD